MHRVLLFFLTTIRRNGVGAATPRLYRGGVHHDSALRSRYLLIRDEFSHTDEDVPNLGCPDVEIMVEVQKLESGRDLLVRELGRSVDGNAGRKIRCSTLLSSGLCLCPKSFSQIHSNSLGRPLSGLGGAQFSSQGLFGGLRIGRAMRRGDLCAAFQVTIWASRNTRRAHAT